MPIRFNQILMSMTGFEEEQDHNRDRPKDGMSLFF